MNSRSLSRLFTVLFFASASLAQTMERPTALYEPPAQSLRDLHQLITAGNPAAESLLVTAMASTPEEEAWIHYLHGLRLCDQQNLGGGITELQIPVTKLRELKAHEIQPFHYRIAAKCLKKIGWCHRRNQEFDKAYGVHQVAYEYQMLHGTWEEVHDACISLDVDAFNLQDGKLSELWLQRGLDAAANIPDTTVRLKAQGMCYNNLAGSLQLQGRHAEAEQAASKSFNAWGAYEDRTGTAENRLVWAWFCIGDVYEFWAKDERTGNDERGTMNEKARDAYGQALKIGRDRGMSEEDLADIVQRLK